MEQNRELPVILRADVTDAFTEPRLSGSGWTSPLPDRHGSNEECVILARAKNNETEDSALKTGRPACPVCGGVLLEIRQKLQCAQCHTICETCCEGGRG